MFVMQKCIRYEEIVFQFKRNKYQKNKSVTEGHDLRISFQYYPMYYNIINV